MTVLLNVVQTLVTLLFNLIIEFHSIEYICQLDHCFFFGGKKVPYKLGFYKLNAIDNTDINISLSKHALT